MHAFFQWFGVCVRSCAWEAASRCRTFKLKYQINLFIYIFEFKMLTAQFY